MPNITLYRDDVESMRSICASLKSRLKEEEVYGSLTDDEYSVIATCERIADLLLIRLAQNCHPTRDPSRGRPSRAEEEALAGGWVPSEYAGPYLELVRRGGR